MPYVSAYSFNCKSIALIVYVAYMLTRINYINIAPISVCAVIFSFRTIINDLLYSIWRLIKSNVITYNLPRFTAYHRHYISVFTGFRLRTCLHKHMRTSFRQILPQTALKFLAGRQPACGFLPCLQQNYARKSAHISYEDRFLDFFPTNQYNSSNSKIW